MPPYDIAFQLGTPHGVAVAVTLPDSPDPVDDAVLGRLCVVEAKHARTLHGYRQPQFVGGRLALHRAGEQLGRTFPAVLPDSRGTPQLPRGLAGSISHKRTLAVAMVAHDGDGTLGVDLEEVAPARPTVARSVLRPEELEAVADLPEARQWIGILLRFSIKESIYKALDPYVRRYVGFHEASVTPGLDGTAVAVLHLAGGEGPFEVDARYHWLPERILTSARIRRLSAP